MGQENSSSNRIIKILGSTVLAGLVGIAALLWSFYSSWQDEQSSKKQLDNQSIQIAKQETQIALIIEQNQLQSQQLTVEAQMATLQSQIPLSENNPDYFLTATVLAGQASQIEATRQAIAIKQQSNEAAQKSASLPQSPLSIEIPTSIPPLPTYTLYPTQTPYPQLPPTVIPTMTAPLLPHTVTIYTQPTDGEVLSLWCTSDWYTCRNMSVSNGMWEGLQVSTIGTGYNEKGEFIIERAFLFFDTSQIPSNATLTSATLYLYSGQWQNGNKSIHVVRSYAQTPLSTSDYSRIDFTSGGYITFGNPLQWENISLSASALEWIIKGGNTKLALINDNDFNNIAPSVRANDVLISTAEDQPHTPYLVINYISP